MNISIITEQTEFLSDIGDVFRIFFGTAAIEIVPADAADDDVYRHSFSFDGKICRDTWEHGASREVSATEMPDQDSLLRKRLRKRAIKKTLYDLLRKETGIKPPWGSLTGIRPTRLYYEGLNLGLTPDQSVCRLINEFDVSPDRAELLRSISDMQAGILYPGKNEFDLYIGIPFCTTRCSYCSFSSGEIGDGSLVEPYVKALLYEIVACAEMVRERGLKLRAGYVGGGTPTAIPCSQLKRILKKALEEFPGAREWTVEAGRPDTIDETKLSMLKANGVTRISVNPQTFSDETLRRIGRAHTGADTIRAFALARKLGFDDINMDLIAALPGETPDDFSHTLDRVIDLAPESVTVHSLAIKHSSRLHEEAVISGKDVPSPSAAAPASMTREARMRLTESGWFPYYLYRQKYVAGNQENIGYARPGKACLYNIGNMEETVSVLALGAGSISKWLFDREAASGPIGMDISATRFSNLELRIERAANVRSIEQYIQRTSEMVDRKRALILGKGDESI